MAGEDAPHEGESDALMNHAERRRYLIEELLAERSDAAGMEVPSGADEQWQLLRALFNMRPPAPASDEFLREQDAFLAEELVRRGGSVGLEAATRVDEGLYLWQGDITRLAVDGIVNAANSRMLGCWAPGHHCIDNAIHTYAGIQLRLECDRIMRAQGHEEPTGCAKITPAYNLPSKYVLHTVGPIAYGGKPTSSDCALLASSYRSCMQLAEENGLSSLAFCCVSTGEFAFPQKQAARIALDTVRTWCRESNTNLEVVFNVFKDSDRLIYEELLAAR